MKTAKQIKASIELHQTAIDLLEYIRNYKKYSRQQKNISIAYSKLGLVGLMENRLHDAEIYSMVAARLTERYNKILKAL